jgi:FtsZ-binding cell division protein ZapB
MWQGVNDFDLLTLNPGGSVQDVRTLRQLNQEIAQYQQECATIQQHKEQLCKEEKDLQEKVQAKIAAFQDVARQTGIARGYLLAVSRKHDKPKLSTRKKHKPSTTSTRSQELKIDAEYLLSLTTPLIFNLPWYQYVDNDGNEMPGRKTLALHLVASCVTSGFQFGTSLAVAVAMCKLSESTLRAAWNYVHAQGEIPCEGRGKHDIRGRHEFPSEIFGVPSENESGLYMACLAKAA